MTCPICHRKSVPEYRPFCSKRCADVDLGRWLVGGYVLPAADSETDSEAPKVDGEGPPDLPH